MKISSLLQFAACSVALVLPAMGGSITTTFAGGNDFTGNMFDVTVGSSGLTVTSLDVNVGSGTPTIDVYIKNGTYVGSQTNPGAWTLVAQKAVTSAGQGNATLVNVNPFFLTAGTTYGFYVTIDTNANAAPYMYYTTGNNVYSNSNLTLTAGEALGGLFGSLGLSPSRTWNGTINYNVGNTVLPEPATFAYLLLAAPLLFLRRAK